MNKKLLFGTIGLLCIAINMHSQSYSPTFNENYPIFGFEFVGYSNAPTARDLFLAENLFYSNENEEVKATVEKKIIDGGSYMLTLLLTINERKALRLQLTLRSDDFAECNYITHIKVANLFDNRTVEHRYQGSIESLGRVLGIFVEVMEMFYNTEKLFA